MISKSLTMLLVACIAQLTIINIARADDNNTPKQEEKGLRAQAVKECYYKNPGDPCTELGLPGKCRTDRSCDTSGSSLLQRPGITTPLK